MIYKQLSVKVLFLCVQHTKHEVFSAS